MEKDELIVKLKERIADVLKIGDADSIPETDLFVKLGIDSLTALELLVCIEQDLKITFADEDLSVDLLISLDGLANYILAQMNQTADKAQ